MDWLEYKKEFIEGNRKKGLFNEQELTGKLSYAYELFHKGMPIIFDVKHLAITLGLNEAEIYKISNGNSNNFYTTFSIPKAKKGQRVIRAPLPNLKLIQEWVLKEILYHLKPSQFCKSYQKNYSLIDNARFHRNQDILVKLDINNFFDNISHHQIYSIFKEIGYNSHVATVFTRFCVINNTKSTGIPQGAPTSPMLSNLVLKTFDEKISEFCLQNKIRYTRYADDLSFSGTFKPHILIKKVEKLLYRHGFQLNNRKHRVLRKNKRQIVTGIVVNEKFQAPRKYRKKIRLEVYFLAKDENEHFKRLQIETRESKKLYLQSLVGKINYVLLVNKNDENFKDYKRIVHHKLREYI